MKAHDRKYCRSQHNHTFGHRKLNNPPPSCLEDKKRPPSLDCSRLKFRDVIEVHFGNFPRQWSWSRFLPFHEISIPWVAMVRSSPRDKPSKDPVNVLLTKVFENTLN